MSDELSNATRIAALEEQVRQLTADAAAFNSILKRGQEWMNSAHDSWQRMCNQREEAREALTKALADNATLNTAKDRLIDERNACLRELDAARQELADRNAYAERLLAENVRLSNEAADVRKELEKYQDSLEVMTTDNNATFEGINAALYAADITFLDKDTYAACIGRLANERDNARKWIDGQDVRSDFPNATAMRQALDRERERSEGLDNDRAHVTLRFNEEALAHFNTLKELERERERCGVLAEEVRISRFVTPTHDATAVRFINTGRTQHGGDRGDPIMQLLAARTETDRTHALDPAKFEGKP